MSRGEKRYARGEFHVVVSPNDFDGLSTIQLRCKKCEEYQDQVNLATCQPAPAESRSAKAKCSNCRTRAVVCDWGNTIPISMNAIKLKIHKEQLKAGKNKITTTTEEKKKKKKKKDVGVLIRTRVVGETPGWRADEHVP